MSSTPRALQRPALWKALLALPMVMIVAACSSSTSSAAQNTPKASATGTTVVTTPPTSFPSVTPIAGTYSVYKDPTWGYTFEYPSSWVVYPSIGTADSGTQESSVTIMEPYTPDPTRTAAYLLVRATNSNNSSFVQQRLCGLQTSTKVDGYPAVVLDTWGGSPTTFYISPAVGRSFFAKGLAFEIWLQSSARESYAIQAWMSYAQTLMKHILGTFSVGTGSTKPTASASGC